MRSVNVVWVLLGVSLNLACGGTEGTRAAAAHSGNEAGAAGEPSQANGGSVGKVSGGGSSSVSVAGESPVGGEYDNGGAPTDGGTGSSTESGAAGHGLGGMVVGGGDNEGGGGGEPTWPVGGSGSLGGSAGAGSLGGASGSANGGTGGKAPTPYDCDGKVCAADHVCAWPNTGSPVKRICAPITESTCNPDSPPPVNSPCDNYCAMQSKNCRTAYRACGSMQDFENGAACGECSAFVQGSGSTRWNCGPSL